MAKQQIFSGLNGNKVTIATFDHKTFSHLESLTDLVLGYWNAEARCKEAVGALWRRSRRWARSCPVRSSPHRVGVMRDYVRLALARYFDGMEFSSQEHQQQTQQQQQQQLLSQPPTLYSPDLLGDALSVDLGQLLSSPGQADADAVTHYDSLYPSLFYGFCHASHSQQASTVNNHHRQEARVEREVNKIDEERSSALQTPVFEPISEDEGDGGVREELSIEDYLLTADASSEVGTEAAAAAADSLFKFGQGSDFSSGAADLPNGDDLGEAPLSLLSSSDNPMSNPTISSQHFGPATPATSSLSELHPHQQQHQQLQQIAEQSDKHSDDINSDADSLDIDCLEVVDVLTIDDLNKDSSDQETKTLDPPVIAESYLNSCDCSASPIIDNFDVFDTTMSDRKFTVPEPLANAYQQLARALQAAYNSAVDFQCHQEPQQQSSTVASSSSRKRSHSDIEASQSLPSCVDKRRRAEAEAAEAMVAMATNRLNNIRRIDDTRLECLEYLDTELNGVVSEAAVGNAASGVQCNSDRQLAARPPPRPIVPLSHQTLTLTGAWRQTQLSVVSTASPAAATVAISATGSDAATAITNGECWSVDFDAGNDLVIGSRLSSGNAVRYT
ncbi:hypothetical protein BOX15_Mlig025632g1 [Macrostomum lignano]|uniref:Uncharacterized protein n=1 Tax=Macrostomum lignano TaxID=282301 RepID=A0A267H804_9PLAT|nr:hypothetical protein BOX15_Mlig025632g1 [Macrostomum lignano]